MSKNGFVGVVKKVIQAQAPNVTNGTNGSKTMKPIQTQVVSQAPGRLRLRVVASDRAHISTLEKSFLSHPDINQVRTNIQNGSITIYHNWSTSQFPDAIAALRDLGAIVCEIIDVPVGAGRTVAANNVANAVTDLNRRVKASTQGNLDLRVLFPLGLACLSVRQLLIKGLQLEIIPWYVLAWYAFDSFLKLHTSSLPEEG